MENTWKPCLIALPAFCCQLNNQYPILYSFQSKGYKRTWKPFLIALPAFYRQWPNNQYLIQSYLQRKLEHTWKPDLIFCPKLYCHDQIINILFHILSKKGIGTYLETRLDFVPKALLSIE